MSRNRRIRRLSIRSSVIADRCDLLQLRSIDQKIPEMMLLHPEEASEVRQEHERSLSGPTSEGQTRSD